MITIRSGARRTDTVAATLEELLADLAARPQDQLRIYHREGVDTDFCIILSHEGSKVLTGGSQLGLRLAAALKDLGQVHHAVWMEMKHPA